MTKYLLLLASASALTVSGCASLEDAYQNSAPSTESFAAVGQEPGWTLNITPDEIRYVGDYGEKTIAGPSGHVRVSGNSQAYVNGRLIVTRIAQTCQDGMSGQAYREQVRLVADGKTLTGCGGGKLPPATLNDSSWTFQSIDDKAVLPNVEANLAFSEGRVIGTAGCNRLNGGYSQQSDKLDFTQMITTRMACPAPQMEQERTILNALQSGMAVSYAEDGTLVLRSPNGTVLRLRQNF